VLNHLEISWPPLAQLVAGLGRAFCAQVGVNAYLTAKGTQTFPLHLDDQDNFILQVEGEKNWRLNERAQRPVHRGRLSYDPDLAYPSFWGPRPPATPQLAELRLRPGDLLYIPRGMPHCAVAEHASSLHLTVSITPLYWLDFLKAALEQAHLHAPELRHALPPGFVGDASLRAGLKQRFASALQSFLDHLSFDQTLDVVLRNRVRVQGFPPDGHLAHLDRLADLRLDSRLCHRPGILCMVEADDRFATIRFGPQHLQAPTRIRPALEFIRDRPRFAVADIPGLDDEGKIVLARRLLQGGLLRFAAD
jgi:ribosomal protein L16 Arg81 hydroxylase